MYNIGVIFYLWRKIPQALLLAGFLSLVNYSGVTEIRTRDTLLAYTRFPGVPLQPLEHHSFVGAKVGVFFELAKGFGIFVAVGIGI